MPQPRERMTMSTRESPGLNPVRHDGSVHAGDSLGLAAGDRASEARDDRFLVLDAVAKEFGSRAAVQPTTLSFGAGEFVTLLGPSGCGKTTLLRLIAGFGHPPNRVVTLPGRTPPPPPPPPPPINPHLHNTP